MFGPPQVYIVKKKHFLKEKQSITAEKGVINIPTQSIHFSSARYPVLPPRWLADSKLCTCSINILFFVFVFMECTPNKSWRLDQPKHVNKDAKEIGCPNNIWNVYYYSRIFYKLVRITFLLINLEIRLLKIFISITNE